MHCINCVLVLLERSNYMRVYKFRGKREDANVWVYGYVFKTHKGNPWFDETIWIFNEDGKFKVEPETVGQYTGLKDKNGVEIYEDDIIRHSEFPAKYYTAKFDMIFGLRFIDSGEYYVMPISPTNRPQTNIIVVGNIHENPELLESHT